MDLADRVAIVTGGASGLGRGICLVLADSGADIVVADMNESGADDVVAEVEAKGRRALVCAVDVTDRASVDRMTKDVVKAFGNIDILVNGAGVAGAPGWVDSQVSREVDWDLAYQVNVKGTVLCSEVVAEHMKSRRHGKIVNIASRAGRQGVSWFAHYSASKAAVINWTQAHAVQLGPYNVNVNCVCPGVIWTPMWDTIARRRRNLMPELKDLSPREVFDKLVASVNPLGREQTPEDIGWTVAFFASELSRNITGQALNVDGGARLN